jgi:hypothetical protein
MFTEKCFFRDVSNELIEGLYKLGGRKGIAFWNSNVGTLLTAESNKFRCIDDEWGNADKLVKNGYINCGNNKELFLAIAALRDDSDYMQWFCGTNIMTGEFSWILCYDAKNPTEPFIPNLRKATVEELKEHFK